MATAAKIVPIRRAGERLSPELRDFLDAVVIPSLFRQFLAETESNTKNVLQGSKQKSDTPAERGKK
jgi:hypothetical protein